MIASQIIQHLPKIIERRRPVMFWGPPGAGKTDVINQVGDNMNRRIVDFRLAMRDPTAIMGFPMPDQKSKTMKFFRDDELPTEGEGILFLDEINSAAQATQAAAMQLTLTGRIGDYVLPDGWSVVAAGNRESDRSVVHRMPAALSLRLQHIDFDIDLDSWVDWAIGHGIESDVIAFIRFRPDLLHKFDPAARSSPNPRGWQFVDEVYKDKNPKDIEHELVKGLVGDGAAGEFVAYVDQIRDLPTIDQILLAPDKVEVPDQPSKQYAISTMMGLQVTPNSMDRLMVYAERLPVEFQVLFARDAVRKDQGVCNTKAFTDWSLKNNKVLR